MIDGTMGLDATGLSPELAELLREAVARTLAMTPEEREEMFRRQRESWARSIADWPKPNYEMIDGVKVYASYEDYCND